MKWLKLSSFEPIPDIQFSLKKPLFAASVVLHYSPVHSRATLEARIPLKGRIAYSIDVATAHTLAGFLFSRIVERDEVKGVERVTHPADFTFEPSSDAPVLAHVQTLPAFLETRDARTKTYGAWIAVGAKIQALRIDYVGGETYVGRLVHVDRPLSEAGWKALPWESKRAFEFDWSDERKTLAAARIHIPIIGKIEIRA